MFDYFGALDIKTLQCHVYLKVKTNINTDETKLWNKQNKLWNMKYLYNFEDLKGTGQLIKTFDLVISHISNKFNTSNETLAIHNCIFKNIYKLLLSNF